jgi:hypothetical protein
MDAVLKKTIGQALALVERVGADKNWEALSEADNQESLAIMHRIQELAEQQRVYPERFVTHGVPDNIIEIFTFYIEWFNGVASEQRQKSHPRASSPTPPDTGLCKPSDP